MRSSLHASVVLVILALVGSATATAASATGPSRDPSEDAWGLGGELDETAIRAYLNALDSVELAVELEVGGPAAAGTLSKVGPILAKRGTAMEIVARFDTAGMSDEERKRGPRITRLKVGPLGDEALQLGPLRLKEGREGQGVVWLGPAGELCFGVAIEFWWFWKSFREELCLESTELTEEGALDFRSVRKGFLASLVPEMRISPEGVVQKYKKRGFLFIRWDGEWKAIDEGAPPVPMPLPVHDWPIHLSDLVDWLPVVEAMKAQEAHEPKKLPPIPLSRVSLRFDSEMREGEVPLEDPPGTLRFSDHEIHLRVNGAFDGRTFRTRAGEDNSVEASWTVAGTVAPSSGRVDIARVRIELDGTLGATLPFEDMTQREASAEFTAGIDFDLSGLEVKTEKGLAVSLPGGLSGAIRGRGTARLVPGRDEPQLLLSPESGLTLSVPGPLVVGRPEEPAAAGGVLILPSELSLSAASADEPLLSIDGTVGTSSAGEAAGSSRNLVLIDASVALAALGADAFGLRTGQDLWLKLSPGVGIDLRAKLNGEAGLEGLRRIVGAALALDLRLPEGGGEFAVRAEKGMALGGRIEGGSKISIDTGPMASAGGPAIVTRKNGGAIDGDARLRLGDGVPSALSGRARLDLGGRFGLALDPASRQAERGSILAGPVRLDVSLGLELAEGAEYRAPDGPGPVVFTTPMLLDLGLAGEIVPGAALDDLGAIEVSIEPIAAKVDLSPE